METTDTMEDAEEVISAFGADWKFGGKTGSAVSKFKVQNGICPMNMEADPLPPIRLPSITSPTLEYSMKG